MSLVTGFSQTYHHHDYYYHQTAPFPESMVEHSMPSPAYYNFAARNVNWAIGSSPMPTQLEMGSLSPDQYGVCGTSSPGDYHAGLSPLSEMGIHYDPAQLPVRCVKRGVTANRKERRRTLSINSAFAQLRGCIPNVPSDTKLSKIKTLRLATSYIAYLTEVLAKDDPDMGEFKAEIKKIDRKKHENSKTCVESGEDKSKKAGRTGWPQAVWASELKQ